MLFPCPDIDQEISISAEEAIPHIGSNQNPLGRSSSFFPFLAKPLMCTDYGYVFYNQRQNLIINAAHRTLSLYDATTLKEMKNRELDDWMTHVSYCDEIDTYIIGCESGFFYSYDASKDEVKRLHNCEGRVKRVEPVNSQFYAFLSDQSNEIYIGGLENEKVVSLNSLELRPDGLHRLAKSSLLLSSFGNGSVKIFNTSKLPHLRVLFSIPAHPNKEIYSLQSFWIKGKEYAMTAGEDQTLKIWHFLKGRMKLLKVVRTNDIYKRADSAVYLESYNMVAVSYNRCDIDFFKLPSWKLERVFYLWRDKHGVFLMKDKNMIGCVGTIGSGCQNVDFIQLGQQEVDNEN